MNDNDVLQQISTAFEACGHLDYGERISMEEHMLQTAWIAERDGADIRTVVASLLHDYGHLVCNMPNNTFEQGDDNFHEDIGADAMSAWFDDDIVSAVRLHVAAKRYLCAANPGYFDKLSKASKVTLVIQGGPMSDGEMRAFESNPAHKLAIRVRVYDDQGKDPQLERPGLEHYFPKIVDCLKQM
jgi:predicted HD phosphohydrolase